MFQSAIEAAEAAAGAWTPDLADPGGGRQCCHLCLHRYRALVLHGPLRDLPHAVAHAAVVAVDDVIAERIDRTLEQLELEAWSMPAATMDDREHELAQRARAATGALQHAALEELSRSESRLCDLRRTVIEPATEAYLLRHRMTEVPWQWEL